MTTVLHISPPRPVGRIRWPSDQVVAFNESAEALRKALDDKAIAAFVARQPTSTAVLPDPRTWAARLATAIAETLHGQRPLQQLLQWTNDSVYDALAAMLARRPHAVQSPSPTLRSVLLCTPTDGVAEASVVIQLGPRCRALAMRLEGLDGRWRCTEFELI